MKGATMLTTLQQPGVTPAQRHEGLDENLLVKRSGGVKDLKYRLS
ncbi:MAG: hypothetical protein WAW36_03055 [Methylovulum miyakonense]